MTEKSPYRAVFAVFASLFMLCFAELSAQDCIDPGLICPLTSTDTVSVSEGVPSGVPDSFCFDDAPNAVFFSFETLDTEQFPSIDYQDSTAFLALTVDSCATDTLAGTGINIAVFSAQDLCDPNTYSEPLACNTEQEEGSQIFMDGLEPSTTYYVMVTGILGDDPDGTVSDCAVFLSVSGPAVEYDLAATPATPQNQQIFPGASADLALNPDFGPYEWSGEQVNPTEGSAVTASPREFGAFTYLAQTEINDCPYREQFLITVVPPVTPFNAFTPNNDGFNDTWEIDRITEWPNAQIIVYSRWGAKVFQATNYRNDWDGDNLPAATYYYVIELNPIDFSTEPITGSVTIVR